MYDILCLHVLLTHRNMCITLKFQVLHLKSDLITLSLAKGWQLGMLILWRGLGEAAATPLWGPDACESHLHAARGIQDCCSSWTVWQWHFLSVHYSAWTHPLNTVLSTWAHRHGRWSHHRRSGCSSPWRRPSKRTLGCCAWVLRCVLIGSSEINHPHEN